MGDGFYIRIMYGISLKNISEKLEDKLNEALEEMADEESDEEELFCGHPCDDDRFALGILQFSLSGSDWDDVIKPMQMPSPLKMAQLKKLLQLGEFTQPPTWMLITETDH
mgnify:CR=1 FL=1